MRGLPAHLRSFLNRWCLGPPAQAGGYMPASLRDCGTVGLWDCGTVGLWDCGTVGLWDCGVLHVRPFGHTRQGDPKLPAKRVNPRQGGRR